MMPISKVVFMCNKFNHFSLTPLLALVNALALEHLSNAIFLLNDQIGLLNLWNAVKKYLLKKIRHLKNKSKIIDKNKMDIQISEKLKCKYTVEQHKLKCNGKNLNYSNNTAFNVVGYLRLSNKFDRTRKKQQKKTTKTEHLKPEKYKATR